MLREYVLVYFVPNKYLSIPLRKIFIGLAKQVIERLASQEHQL